MDYFSDAAPIAYQPRQPLRTPPVTPPTTPPAFQYPITNVQQPSASPSLYPQALDTTPKQDLMYLGEPATTPTNVYTPPTVYAPPPPPTDTVANQFVAPERMYQAPPPVQAYPLHSSSTSVQKQDLSLSALPPQQLQLAPTQQQVAPTQQQSIVPQQQISVSPQHHSQQAPVPAYQPPQQVSQILSSSSRPQNVDGMLVPTIAHAPISPAFQTSSTVPSMKPDRVVQLLEQMQSNFDNIFQRLDGIENRMTSLELVTKEILGNQRIQSQQRKLQEPVDPPRVAFPPHTQSLYEAPRDDYLKKPAIYSPPPMPTPSVSNHQMYPSVSSPAPPAMNFVQATQIKSSSSSNAYDADLELAKKLQASFDQEAPKSEPVKKPVPAAEGKTQECPMCQTKVSVADLEAHVESHFDDPVKKSVAKDAPKESPKTTGFLGKLFGGKDEKETKPEPTAKETPHPPTAGYPRMVPASSFYGPGGYHYPSGYPAQQMGRPANGRPGQQPYLYYPSAEQHQ